MTHVRVMLPANLSPEEQQILVDANQGNPDSRGRVRELLARRADVAASFEAALSTAEDAVVRLGTGDNILQAELSRRKLEDMRVELRQPEDGSLEEMLINRIAVSWMLANHLQAALAFQVGDGSPAVLIGPWSKLLSRANRDLLHATRTLAAVRALRKRGPSIQVNVQQQVAVSSNEP